MELSLPSVVWVFLCCLVDCKKEFLLSKSLNGSSFRFNELFSSQGQATDIQIQAEEILRLKDKINNLLVKHSGLSIEKLGEL